MPRHAVYGAVLFLASACGLSLEIAAARLLAPYVDMSLHIWTAIIAVVVAGFATGNWIGGRLADRAADATAGGRRLAALLALAAITTLLALVFLRPVANDPFSVTPLVAIVGLSALLFLAPSVCIGAISPLLTKLAVEADPPTSGRTIGRMYALGAAGAILGTAATGYVLVPHLGAIGTAILIAGVEGALALGFALAGRPKWNAAFGLAAAAILVGAAGAATGAFRSTCTAESSYYCITMLEGRDTEDRPLMSIFLDKAEHSANSRDDPTYLYWPYAHFLDEMLTARDKTAPRVFYLGGGGYTLPRALLARDPGATIIVAELDPAVTRAAMRHMWVTPDPRMTITHGDGRLALQELPSVPTFDAMVGDAYQNLEVPPHLVTREFTRAIRARLKPDGFFAMNLIDAREHSMLLYSVLRTLLLDFPVVEVWLEADEVWYWRSVSFMVIAGDRPTATDRLESKRGPARAWKRLPADQLLARMEEADARVLTDDYAPVERLTANFCALRALEPLGIHLAHPGRCP